MRRRTEYPARLLRRAHAGGTGCAAQGRRVQRARSNPTDRGVHAEVGLAFSRPDERARTRLTTCTFAAGAMHRLRC